MPKDIDATNRVLEVRDLVTRFYTPEGVVHAVNGVSFSLNEGGTLGIVGESGCGKSVTMLSVLRLISEPPGKIEQGEAIFRGQDLLKTSQGEMRAIRGSQIAMVFQDPMTSLNPVMTIGRQVAEPLIEHLGLTHGQADGRVVELLNMVGIPDAKSRLGDYPHQFSGGMRQRVMISMALACNPSILIADEPTTALDVTIQAQIIELVKRLRDELGMAVIWITHDLGIIAGLAERVVVMYAGFVVERARVRGLYSSPQHPYTLGLLGSLPRIDGRHSRRLANIDGRPPDLLEEPLCCPFAPRCSYVLDVCWKENPGLRAVGDEHDIACWVNVGEVARPQTVPVT
jgi:oligopeptide transport system ATP-binding protein